jgi:photosystem II stability/assembly factor-like uncharacterized protein
MPLKTFNQALLLLLSVFFISSLCSQTPQWRLLPSSPTAGRFDDLVFINARTGWAVVASADSKIFKTTDGGLSWALLHTFTGRHSRSICFIDSLTGFLGSLNGAQHLFKTTNGGLNWDSVSFSSDRPEGICGMSYFGNTIIGSGVYSGAPKVIWSTDRGSSWQVFNLISVANALVDCYLVSENEAFIIGGIGTTYENRSCVILRTINSGSTWETKFTSSRPANWGWKISFANLQTAYVSIENQNYMESSYFAKTTNGGLSWAEMFFGTGSDYQHEGIGFVNENTGWIGTFNNLYQTTNGGFNWSLLALGGPFQSVNRMRFYGDTLGYAGGIRAYKYTADNTIGVNGIQSTIPAKNMLEQNYPNPFNPVTVIKYEMFENSVSTIRIFNSAGEEVYVFVNGFRSPGVKEFTWYGTDNNGVSLPSGVYFYRLETENFSETKKMILVR